MNFSLGKHSPPGEWPLAPAIAVPRLLVLCWFAVAACFILVAWKTRIAPLNVSSMQVDPNSAPWWEMTILPEIGPSLARRIVDYRESQRAENRPLGHRKVFESADDLDPIAGIGPKTIAGLSPLLRFDDEVHSASSPSAMQNHRKAQEKQDQHGRLGHHHGGARTPRIRD